MGYMYLGLPLFGTSEEVVIKLRLGRLVGTFQPRMRQDASELCEVSVPSIVQHCKSWRDCGPAEK